MTQADKIKAILEAIGWTEIVHLFPGVSESCMGLPPNYDPSEPVRVRLPDLANSITAWFAQGGPVEWLGARGYDVHIIKRNWDEHWQIQIAGANAAVATKDVDLCAALIEAVYAAVQKVQEG